MTPPSVDTLSSEDLVAALLQVDAYPGGTADSSVVVHETHVSWVFLVGPFAYKVKKPITTSFLDYGTLARRQRYCHEEIRLDQRYAKDLYLGVVPITIDDGRVCVEGTGQPIEFAVKMRRFPDDALLSDRLETGKLTTAEVFQLAGAVASFHRDAERADPQSPWGSCDLVLRSAMDNLRELRTSSAAGDLIATLKLLDQWTTEFFDEHQLAFSQRQTHGFIRECHGDLHLANVIHWHGRLMPFDGIEFNDEFRWIDVMSDAAFLAMDFAARGHPDLCRSFINAYLQQTGDHTSLPLLGWYLVYRAMVRAKVASIRTDQSGQTETDRSLEREDCRSHVELAYRLTLRKKPCLWITHGVSGSGKTYGSELVVQRRGAIQLRSDIERKRHFGLAITERPDDETKAKIYGRAATDATYKRLRQLARGILHAGYSVIVDATFLQQYQRELFHQLARSEGANFTILDFHADQPTLRRRLARRMAQGTDASDADAQVLQSQLASIQPLTAAETQHVGEIPDTVSAISAL